MGAGCCTRIDVGFLGYGNYLGRAVSAGKVKVFDYTNGVLASRILAGARGIRRGFASGLTWRLEESLPESKPGWIIPLPPLPSPLLASQLISGLLPP